jgi:DNA-binding NarL/FixJ family response regulator
MQDTSTALLASNLFLNNQNLLQLLTRNKLQIVNKALINTKEGVLPEVETHKPNYLFFSSTLPGVIEASEIISKIKQASPKTKIVLVINENDSSKILNYVIANTDAIIYTECLNESLEFAIKQLSKGQIFLCGITTKALKSALHKQQVENKSDSGLLNSLTDREVEVLHSLTQGVNYKQISKLLFISESTVKTHINNIFTKLNVNDRTQAVLYALHHGIDNLSKKPNLFKSLVSEPVEK